MSRIIALTEKVLKFIFGFLLSIFHIFPFYDDFYSFAKLTNEIEHQIYKEGRAKVLSGTPLLFT